MHEIFKSLTKGSQIVIETTFEVLDIDHTKNTITLRNLRNGEILKHTDWWFVNIQQNGFTIHFID